jgi:hypothetical protein
MITRFRVEGKNKDKNELLEELSVTASIIISTIAQAGVKQEGAWECTDDVISGDNNRGYQGRMVLKFEQAA